MQGALLLGRRVPQLASRSVLKGTGRLQQHLVRAIQHNGQHSEEGFDPLRYRRNVGVCVVDCNGLVFCAQRRYAGSCQGSLQASQLSAAIRIPWKPVLSPGAQQSRSDSSCNTWQMPQGGIDDGEPHRCLTRGCSAVTTPCRRMHPLNHTVYHVRVPSLWPVKQCMMQRLE
jgi:hypothetical protein